LTKKLVPRRIPFVRPADDVDSKTGQCTGPDLVDLACDVLGQDPSLPVRFSHDARNFYMRDARSGKLLLTVPKISNEFFLEIAELFVGPIVRGASLPLPVSEVAVAAAVERHRLAESRRIRANLRYERNRVATRRAEGAVIQAVEDRLRLHIRLENAAWWFNQQLSSKWKYRDSLFTYDYRTNRAVYWWTSDALPVPPKDGDNSLVGPDGKSLRLHGISPVRDTDSE
jgi:hypothetical protein